MILWRNWGGWHALNVFFFSLCLNAWMPGSRKFSQNFHWKILSNFLMVSDVSLEMQSDSKNYVGLQDDKITEPVHTIKSACAWHLENLRLYRHLEIINELLQKASFEPNGMMRCLFGIAKRFLKLLWICSDEFGKLVHTIKSRHIGFIRLPVTVSNRLSKCPAVRNTLFFYKNVVFSAQAEYSYFSADFRVRISL